MNWDAPTAIMDTLLLYAAMTIAGMRILRFLRRRRWPWAVAIPAMLIPMFFFAAAIFVMGQQRHLQMGRPLRAGVSRRIVGERFFGPFLLERSTEETWPDVKAVYNIERWETGDIPFGGLVPSVISGGIAFFLVRRAQRRAERGRLAPSERRLNLAQG